MKNLTDAQRQVMAEREARRTKINAKTLTAVKREALVDRTYDAFLDTERGSAWERRSSHEYDAGEERSHQAREREAIRAEAVLMGGGPSIYTKPMTHFVVRLFHRFTRWCRRVRQEGVFQL